MAEEGSEIIPFVRIVGMIENPGKMRIRVKGRSMRVFVALTILTAVSACCSGCRMCADPYDYCQPTYTGECGQQCCPTYRAGSVLTPNCGGCEQCGNIAGGGACSGGMGSPGGSMGCPDCQAIPTEGPVYQGQAVGPAPAVQLRPVPSPSDQSATTKKTRYSARPVSYETTTAQKQGIPNAGAPIGRM